MKKEKERERMTKRVKDEPFFRKKKARECVCERGDAYRDQRIHVGFCCGCHSALWLLRSCTRVFYTPRPAPPPGGTSIPAPHTLRTAVRVKALSLSLSFTRRAIPLTRRATRLPGVPPRDIYTDLSVYVYTCSIVYLHSCDTFVCLPPPLRAS